MATRSDRDLIPRLRPTPLTWVYVVFAVAALVLMVWGFVEAGRP